MKPDRPKFRRGQELRCGPLRFHIAYSNPDRKTYEVHVIFKGTHLGSCFTVSEAGLLDLQEWLTKLCYSSDSDVDLPLTARSGVKNE